MLKWGLQEFEMVTREIYPVPSSFTTGELLEPFRTQGEGVGGDDLWKQAEEKNHRNVCTEEKPTTWGIQWAEVALKCPSSGQALVSICVVQKTCGKPDFMSA